MTKALLLSILLFYTGLSCRAQSNSDEVLMSTIHTLRNELFIHEKNGIAALKALLERLDAKGVSDKDLSKFLLNAWYSYAVLKDTPKYVRKQMIKYFPGVGHVYEDEDLNIIQMNAHLVDLLNEGLLKPKYPFPLDEKSNLFPEFQEYGLKDSLKIGEIGAGSGLIGLLMASTYDHLEIYMNELNFGLLKYMETRISQFPTLRNSNKLHVVKGNRKTTNLEGKNLDLIFMRDAFHHFSKKEAMIASIYQSLNEQGVAFVIEHVTDGMTEPPGCLQAMKRDDIVQLFENGGFMLVEERGNGGDYIFKFQK